jgi:hypothetical protein
MDSDGNMDGILGNNGIDKISLIEIGNIIRKRKYKRKSIFILYKS